MASIEIEVVGRKFVLTGEENEEHLNDVAQMVRRKVEAIHKEKPSINLQKAAMLAAFDLASQVIHGKRRANAYRTSVMAKASHILRQVESELASELPTE